MKMIVLFLLVFLGGQFYVSWRVWHMLPPSLGLRLLIVGLMAIAFVSFFVALSGALDHMPMAPATVFYEVGTSWLMILLYLGLLFLLLDLGRAVGLVPRSWLHANACASLSVAVLMLAVFGYGNWHYEHKVRVPLDLKSPKAPERPLTIVMASDLHLGYHNTRADLRRWIGLINRERPDVVLLAGDIVDRSIRPVEATDMAAEFAALQAPVYACLGNHDYYTGLGADLNFCRQAGIHVLRDSVAMPLDGLCVVGRDDRTNPRRLPLADVMRQADRSRYIIELDHQPYALDEAQRAGVDLEFAGHTHYGQVWPLSWITDLIYEDAFGPLTKGNTHYYVSSGLGIWGAKFRIGTQSEYIVARLHR